MTVYLQLCSCRECLLNRIEKCPSILCYLSSIQICSTWEIILKSPALLHTPKFFLRAFYEIGITGNSKPLWAQISHKSIKILLAPPQLTILTFEQKKERKKNPVHFTALHSEIWKNTPQKAFMYLNWAKKMVAFSLLKVKAEKGNLSSIFFMNENIPSFTPFFAHWILDKKRELNIYNSEFSGNAIKIIDIMIWGGRSDAMPCIASEISLDFGWF